MTEKTSVAEVKLNSLLEACEFIADFTGSCPSDMKGWEHPKTCSKHCHAHAEKKCWKTYFEQQASNTPIQGERSDTLE